MDDPTAPNPTTRDFYDRLNDNPWQMLLSLGAMFLFIAFFFTVFLWDDSPFFLLICFVAGFAILFAVPRKLRDTYLAYRGTPALRINEAGFWAREWSYLGWISWRDVVSVEIEGNKNQSLVAILRDKEFARLAGHDQASIMLARFGGLLFFTDVGPNRLRLISSLQLASRWERLTTTLDPILAANGVPQSRRRIRA
jgi:hypothetical protein